MLLAVIVALVLDAAGDVSAIGLALTVAAVGFATSWIVTGRRARTATVRHHRVATIPLRHSVG